MVAFSASLSFRSITLAPACPGHRSLKKIVLLIHISTSLSLAGNLGRLTCKKKQPQEQRYRFLSVCAGFSCVHTVLVVWLPVLGIFDVRTDVKHAIAHAGGCTDTARVCTESWLWETNPLPPRGLEPESVLRLTFLSDAPPLSSPRSPTNVDVEHCHMAVWAYHSA